MAFLRAGIVSLSRGQWDAAYSLGLGTYATYRYVILPQAVRRVLPPASRGASECITRLPESSERYIRSPPEGVGSAP